jgi:hypothetical protein
MRKWCIFLVGIVAFGLILVVEGIYILRNRPDLILMGMVKLQKYQVIPLVELGSTEIKLRSLVNLAELRSEQMGDVYELVKSRSKVDIPSVSGNNKVELVFDEMLSKVDYISLFEPNSKELVKLFYLLGLKANEIGENQMVIPLWEMTLRLAPYWSYFYMELANYYLDKGQREESLEVIDYCLLFEYAKKGCLYYYDNQIVPNRPLEVGAYRGYVEENFMAE